MIEEMLRKEIEELKADIHKECLSAFDMGASAFKKSMIDSLEEALALMPNVTGQSLFEIIKNVDVPNKEAP